MPRFERKQKIWAVLDEDKGLTVEEVHLAIGSTDNIHATRQALDKLARLEECVRRVRNEKGYTHFYKVPGKAPILKSKLYETRDNSGNVRTGKPVEIHSANELIEEIESMALHLLSMVEKLRSFMVTDELIKEVRSLRKIKAVVDSELGTNANDSQS